MQVFMYAWIKQKPPQAPTKGEVSQLAGKREAKLGGAVIQPTLYYIRDFFSSDFDPVISYGKEKAPVIDFAIYQDEFEDCMRACLDQIFDPSIPFTQTTNTRHCAYCPFVDVCGR